MGVRDAVLLAVDAGNSKTDLAFIDADGSVIVTARGPGFRPQAVGVEAAFDAISPALEEALAKAAALGRPVESVAHVSACLAGADLPVEEKELVTALQGRGWGRTVEVRNDTFAILRAGLSGSGAPLGVAVVCGAGINCVGMLPDGRTARFPALGQLSGDWGGGGGLAAEAMWWAARAEDGRGGPTGLTAALPGHFGLGSMYELIEAVHLGVIAPERTHELVPVLFAVAAAGDEAAIGLVERQADEVVALAAVALERLGLLEREAPVLLGGSVLAARHPRLDDRVREGLAERAPLARVSVVTAPPVLGAGLLGLDALGAPSAAYGKLRAHFG
ncbi:BadF/BadG/BcrA/BcrD ATPase family protein [Streptomyces sp. G-G2]|uniref:N-acetylglucosamine kinase n=1 Tax=Streptomyces sp. G-G2 TaxID=3046201 RepID=UPI0024BA4789|nr:BadF/BadG/BcrA/BcrD ATPase family protein [Streptomyces sp. G-G2]MDJ0379787.1 BadF/BadG/BcrA/BcrD ATPase family protein [Streptomyces sp. G-G2]